MDLTLTIDTLYLRPYPRHRKAMLSVASHPVYKVLDSVIRALKVGLKVTPEMLHELTEFNNYVGEKSVFPV